ncbi:uncharacterized protein N7496_004964 [Penicillium cataractarum]|uniref:Uncharacterized protein n=1 Tax=Penicillium cataractarum TaxID=2100454 RepID=A0A9W9SFP9_9EURO|nr:uncharacterized protein N7496_004964 [Penicillium cataractarum]KAJ5377555.1 hypothetical protein N7496_004964 [Penicillium cataractarum]
MPAPFPIEYRHLDITASRVAAALRANNIGHVFCDIDVITDKNPADALNSMPEFTRISQGYWEHRWGFKFCGITVQVDFMKSPFNNKERWIPSPSDALVINALPANYPGRSLQVPVKIMYPSMLTRFALKLISWTSWQGCDGFGSFSILAKLYRDHKESRPLLAAILPPHDLKRVLESDSIDESDSDCYDEDDSSDES